MKRKDSKNSRNVFLDKKILREMIKSGEIKGVSDVEELLKGMFADILQELLEAEMEDSLGYSKYDYNHKMTDNDRNGYSSKKIRTTMEDMDISIPRDRKSEFEPRVVPKYSKEVSSQIEGQILSMYAKGMSLADIHEQKRYTG